VALVGRTCDGATLVLQGLLATDAAMRRYMLDAEYHAAILRIATEALLHADEAAEKEDRSRSWSFWASVGRD
jgi:hypothetical protein